MSGIIKKLIILKDNIRYRDEDGYINATSLCESKGKKFSAWHRLDRTKNFLEALQRSVGKSTHLIEIINTGANEDRGTWVHPKVAISLGQWLSADFEVKIINIVEEWNETKNLTEEQRQIREIIKHTDIQEQKRNSRNLREKIITTPNFHSLANIHREITTAISGKSPSKWKALGNKRRESETSLIQEGQLKPHKRIYKLRDVVSGLAVIRIENKPTASAISLAHNCITEKDSPMKLAIEAGKSSLQLFKNLQKIENYNKKKERIGNI